MTTTFHAPAPVARRLFSADEYERMIAAGILTEDERVELIDGEIRPMSPIGSQHAACVNRLIALLTQHFGRRAIISAQNPVRLSDDTEPQPDITVLRPRDDFYAGALPRGRDVLLVVEVADASLGFDREVKLPHYPASDIAEAWLVDLTHEVIERHTRPMHGRYAEVVTFQRGETLYSSALDLSVRVEEIIG
ncbi:MAG: Uma2 family endonuclease [Candidatus Brachytrichaceae bacterium NZ_4S206]|jgi:Uma2 family endonuclease